MMKSKASLNGFFAALAVTLIRVRRVGLMMCLVFVLFLSNCGPVNQKPAENLSLQSKNMCDPGIPTEPMGAPSSGPSGTPPPNISLSYSQNKDFIVAALLQDVDTGQSPNDQPSAMTDNLYVFRFVSGRNLSAPSPNAQLTVSYSHTTSTGVNTYVVPDVSRQGDHFVGTVHFGQSGSYALHLHLTDGAIQDDHIVYVNP